MTKNLDLACLFITCLHSGNLLEVLSPFIHHKHTEITYFSFKGLPALIPGVIFIFFTQFIFKLVQTVFSRIRIRPPALTPTLGKGRVVRLKVAYHHFLPEMIRKSQRDCKFTLILKAIGSRTFYDSRVTWKCPQLTSLVAITNLRSSSALKIIYINRGYI